jgi:hypothetical protein
MLDATGLYEKVGGCSASGFMTLDHGVSFPDVFAQYTASSTPCQKN